ncbi:MAG: hypothetical protein REI09_13970 [Candidatus Dactylopiibacterium sp.]|nr:hypothetical protein [Candidatus Dactylopiibacterium sp.]
MDKKEPLILHARPVTPGEVGQKIHEQWTQYRAAELQRRAKACGKAL